MRIPRVWRSSEPPAPASSARAVGARSVEVRSVVGASIERSGAHVRPEVLGGASAVARGVAKKAGACALAAALALGFGARVHAGQFASEAGAHVGRAGVVASRPALDVGPEVISAAVERTLREQARTATLFQLPKPDPRFESPPAEVRPSSKLAHVVMSRIAEIVNEEPRTRQRLMQTGGSIAFDELTIGQQSRITDVLLASAGLTTLLTPGSDEEVARQKLEDVLARGFSIVVDPVALGVGVGYSEGRPETGRYSMSITYDRAPSGPDRDAPPNGLEVMINYQLAF
ncbi:hypothetical protein L6R52_40305 [Myxococcota bacterium]|nr:hypothetical protein [Myxococcota bacterium]